MSCHIQELRTERICAECSRCVAASWSSLAQDKGRGHVILGLRGGREG